ncbi:DASH complex subunit DAD1 [Microdochium nivale]|nr:DASH complex subunit DAD1 [Microdochium nivale]
MSHYNRPTSSMSASAGGGGAGGGGGYGGGQREKTYFEQQREALIGEIAMSFEHVLANINKLNRSLEAVIAVGNEFSSVEALWSQFENVMAKEPEDGANQPAPSTSMAGTAAAGQHQHIKTEDDEDEGAQGAAAKRARGGFTAGKHAE